MEKKIYEIMNAKPYHLVTGTSNMTVKDAATKMSKSKVGCLIITKDENILGIFTERDLINNVIARNESLDNPVSYYMTKKVYAIEPHCSIEEAMTTMLNNKIRHLMVMDNDQILGLISSTDLMKAMTELKTAQVGHLHNYIWGKYPA